ncbi:MAG: hypothetical protein GY888_15435 [Planctomycetaceae bacterium]|nr:hypothetical protein [Planctomycetaceae bacterium]
MKPAKFTQGMGRLTADILNNYQDVSRAVEQAYEPFQGPTWAGPYLMKVKLSEAMQTTDDPPVDIPNRWLYDLVGMQVEDIRVPSTWYEQDFETDGPYAINMVEAPNTDTVALGVTRSSLPTGFSLQPIPDGTLVWAYFTPDVGQPGFQCVFSATNQFDGTC